MKRLFVLLVIFIGLLLAGCSPLDPATQLNEPLYFKGNVYTWNGTAYQLVNTLGGGSGNLTVEVDPIFSISPAFGITAGNIVAWNGHPLLTTGTHGVTGTIVGTSDIQSLTRKKVTMDNNEPIYWDNTIGTDIPVFNLWLDDNLHILDGGSSDIFVWLSSGTGKRMFLWPTSSTAISTLKDSPTLDFVANYWDVTNKNWEAKVIHNMVSAGITPKSRLEFEINSENILRLENNNGVVKTYSDGTIDMTTHQINNVVDPTLAQDAATKNYVDSIVAGNVTAYVPYIGATDNVDLGTHSLTTDNLTVTGSAHIGGLPVYVNNAAALLGGLVAGDLYRTNGDPDLVCVVH